MTVKHNFLTGAGLKPSVAESTQHEIVVNEADGTLWTKDSLDAIVQLGGGSGGGGVPPEYVDDKFKELLNPASTEQYYGMFFGDPLEGGIGINAVGDRIMIQTHSTDGGITGAGFYMDSVTGMEWTGIQGTSSRSIIQKAWLDTEMDKKCDTGEMPFGTNDLIDMDGNGIYDYDGTIGAPVGAAIGDTITMSDTFTDFATQTFHIVATNKMYIRSRLDVPVLGDPVWTPWTELSTVVLVRAELQAKLLDVADAIDSGDTTALRAAIATLGV
jgi:hypothetical protein